MPETEFTTTTELTKWKMLSTEEIHEKFFEFARDNSDWVRDLYEVEGKDKDEALVCLCMIAGAANFARELLRDEKADDSD